VVLARPDYEELYEVLDTREGGRSAFTLSSKTTRLMLRGEQLGTLFDDHLRDTAVHAESVELPWALRPVSGFVSGKLLTLDSAQPDLPEDRWLAVSGHTLDAVHPASQRASKRLQAGDALAAVQVAPDGRSATLTFLDGVALKVLLLAASEVVQLRRATVQGVQTQLELRTELTHPYLPATLRINANVVAASHGDSQQRTIQQEVLGSGDGAAALQRFELRGRPLTHTSAATPSGTRSSLEVRVDDVLWPQVDRLAELGPADRGYIARQADDGTVSVQFGDGVRGRRLPSGVMNVKARYRVGIGLAGNVAAGQISQLRARALGVKDVINPLPAAGAADPETRDEARRNAPLAVRTLDRIVSLSDFEDFASAFAGIGKAQAGWLWDGEGRLVQLTVSGVDGLAIAPQSVLALNLRAAVDAVRPAHQALVIAPAQVLRFGLTAGVRVLPGYETPAVLAALRTALADAFGFAQRAFAQSLAASQLLDVMQHTAGVDWVDLDELRLQDDTPAHTLLATERGADARLRARGARWEAGAVQPAQLLLIAPGDIVLNEITALPDGPAA
jgi:predicted phage baseplate assembly protein